MAKGKMWKIDLTRCFIDILNKDGKEVSIEYDMRGSLFTILTHPALKLLGAELLENGDIGLRIKKCEDDDILLDDSEYKKLYNATLNGVPLSTNDIELVRRIKDAEQVTVEEERKG